MIETFLGNSMAQSGEREFQNAGRCSCHADDWEDIDVCENDVDKKCCSDCPQKNDMCVPLPAIECQRCGEIRIIE